MATPPPARFDVGLTWETLTNLSGHLLHFRLILGALFEPCSSPRGPQDGPRAAQDAFRRRLGGVLEPGAAQEAPSPPPGLDSRPPDLDFGASRPAFWEDFTCNMLIRWFFLWRSSVPECI